MHTQDYSLEKLEKFVRLLHEVQRVKRVARRPDESEMTSTAEHTFELAMTCWYVVAIHKLELDLEKVLSYALAHDLIEAYAGDTPVYDEEGQKTKAKREADALARIESEFPEFGELVYTIHEYEKRETPESKFVYAVDKLIDPLNSSMEETQSIWKDYDVSFTQLMEYKTPKIAQSQAVVPYWDLLVKKIQTRQDFFFDS